jgi:hypothetical protein
VVVRERVMGPSAAGVEEAAAGLPVLRHQPEAVLLLVLVLGHHGHHHGTGRRPEAEGKKKGGAFLQFDREGWRELVSCT